MLSKASTLKGYKLDSLDGDIGKVKEFYFDDQHWTMKLLFGLLMTAIAAVTGFCQLAPHAGIQRYDGPSTCVACHQTEAQDVFHSVHYQQTGPTPNVTNIEGNAGERGDGAIAYNSYCGSHITSSRATCAACHIGNGQFPTRTVSPAQLNNIDCLLCHQDAYRRTAAPPYQGVPILAPEPGNPNSERPAISKTQSGVQITWQSGILTDAPDLQSPFLLIPDAVSPYTPAPEPQRFYRLELSHNTIRVPVESETGFHYQPDEAHMAISVLEAARTVHLPTRASCLRCHATAGGRDGGKRGDISSVTASPPLTSDIHMSPQGADLTCSTCHSAGAHRFRGRGLDLRPNDSAERLTCARCHTERPHGDYSTEQPSRDGHAERVACQSCHIPQFARDLPTEMTRDWLTPQFDPVACSGQGGWAPSITLRTNVTPVYQWFDGTSRIYVLGQSASADPNGEYGLAVPNGSVTSAGAKVYPMKRHTSVQPRHRATGQMIPQSTFVFFTTASFTQAIDAGQLQTGLSGPYDLVPTYELQTINHGVQTTTLNCVSCHGDASGYPGSGARVMQPVAELGYALKGTSQAVCTQCHEYESPQNFKTTHEKHRRYDCSWCHSFSRPERGLTLP